MSLRLEDPILAIPADILQTLTINLSLENPLNHNWKSIAGYIGLPSQVIMYIDEQGGNKAFKLLKVWNSGIRKNRGTVLKLIIVLSECRFPSYLQEMSSKLQDHVDLSGVNDYIAQLKSSPGGIKGALFPKLHISDVVLDNSISEFAPDRGDLPDCEPYPDTGDISPWPKKLKNSVYVSYFSSSRCHTYKRHVENMVKYLRSYGHKVWISKRFKINLTNWKQQRIEMADTVIVVYNSDYQSACRLQRDNRPVPSCVAVDIACIRDLATYKGGADHIVPVFTESCKNQCDYGLSSALPYWLSRSVSPITVPAANSDLVRCIQGVPEYKIERPIIVTQVKPKVINSKELIRRHQEEIARLACEERINDVL